jgi:hypothetical protein
MIREITIYKPHEIKRWSLIEDGLIEIFTNGTQVKLVFPFGKEITYSGLPYMAVYREIIDEDEGLRRAMLNETI